MKRIKCHILCLMVLLAVPAAAQEKYTDLLQRTQSLSPYEALYQLNEYQQTHPALANVYYQMGNITYMLIPAYNPLRDYHELSLLYYQTRLYYGNCMHFAAKATQKAQLYSDIPNHGNHLPLETLKGYLQPRMDSVLLWAARTDTLHNRFYRMVDNYNTCRSMFTAFMEHNTREKNAHLMLDSAGRQQLTDIHRHAEQLNTDIALFQQALTVAPIRGYEPHFVFIPIELYRLDGLTSTNFLQDTVPLWDYGAWTTRFMQAQDSVYQVLYDDIVREHHIMQQCAQLFYDGQILPIEVAHPVLPNRIERMDYHSPVSSLLQIEHLAYSAMLLRQDTSILRPVSTRQEAVTPLTMLYRTYCELPVCEQHRSDLSERLDSMAMMKYRYCQNQTKMNNKDSLIAAAQRFCQLQKDAYQQAVVLLDNATRTLNGFVSYYDEMNEETIAIRPKPKRHTPADTAIVLQRKDATGKVLATYTLPLSGYDVADVMPIGDVVVVFAQDTTRTCALWYATDGTLLRTDVYSEGSNERILWAVRMSDNIVAILSRKASATDGDISLLRFVAL